MENFYKKTSVLCAMWLVGAGSLQNLDAKKHAQIDGEPHFSASTGASMKSIAFAMQDIAKTTKMIMPGVKRQAGMPEVSTALNILGQVLQVAVDLKKKYPDHQSLSAENNKFRNCTTVGANGIDLLTNIIGQTAQLQSVKEGSVLWLFKKGTIRANQELLLRHILADPNGRAMLMRDFFSTLQGEITAEVDALVNAPVLPGALAKMREFFQAMFGLGFWRNAFNAWIVFIVDTAQYLMNSSIDTMQEEVDAAMDNYAEAQANPILNVVIDQANTILQGQIDDWQGETNQLIDEKQAQALVKNVFYAKEELLAEHGKPVWVVFSYDVTENVVGVSAPIVEQIVLNAAAILEQQEGNEHLLNEVVNMPAHALEKEIVVIQSELDHAIHNKKEELN